MIGLYCETKSRRNPENNHPPKQAVKMKNLDARIVAGQPHFFRLSRGAFTINLREVPEEKREKEIANCHW